MEELVQDCPYDPCHRCKPGRFTNHLMKCRRNWKRECSSKGKRAETFRCQYDTSHVHAAPELRWHEKHCYDKAAGKEMIIKPELGMITGQEDFGVNVGTVREILNPKLAQERIAREREMAERKFREEERMKRNMSPDELAEYEEWNREPAPGVRIGRDITRGFKPRLGWGTGMTPLKLTREEMMAWEERWYSVKK